MKASFVLGRIFGIEIRIHYSWFFILIFLSWSLAVAYFPQSDITSGLSVTSYWILGIVASLSLFLSVLAHELGHSIVARRNGIPVSNITLFLFGGSANITREAQSSGAEFRMAVTGPMVSFGLAGLFFTIYAGLGGVSGGLTAIMLYLAQVNLILGIFNLLPGFPLDGGRVFKAIVWQLTKNEKQATRIAASSGQVMAYMMIFGGVALAFVVGISGLWLALIGWFLASAATASYQQTIVSEVISGVRVRDVANQAVINVGPEISGEQALAAMSRHSQRALPVVIGGRLVGLITLADLKHISLHDGSSVTVEQIMTPLEKLSTLNPDDDMSKALQILTESGYNQLPVIEEGRVSGLLTRSDIINFIQIHSDIRR
ncbi:peptidase M50 [Dehalogenimonas lykanthroporepellens BL-DC-9]|nr:peptidase M50 [Dehalogenimonas lykanthroporepellens BL-DC-9]